MEARVNKRWPWNIVRAFTGREYIKAEWRHVPDGCEAELDRLVDGNLLEKRVSLEKRALPESKPSATKAAMAIAAQHDIDLASIEGSGSGGRVVVGDVQALIAADEEE